jgi:hypothetical protein
MKRDNNLIILLLFMLGCGLFVELNFRYWYAFMEQYMMFQTTSDYLVRHLTEPGGMVGYLTDFISMGFYYPLCAALVIALIAGIVSYSFHRFLKACGVERSMLIAVAPATLLLLFPQESIAHMLTLTVAIPLAAAYTAIKNDKARWSIGFIALTAIYFLAAPANLIFALMVAVYELIAHRRYGVAATAIAWSALLPLLAMNIFYTIPMREAYIGKHIAHPEVAFPAALWVMGTIYPILAVALRLIGNKRFIVSDKWHTRVEYSALAITLIACIIFKVDLMGQPYMYDHLAREGKWEKIVEHSQRYGIRDFDALIYTNLALSHTGRMATDFTRTPQLGLYGLYPRDTKYYIQNILSSEVSWQVGHVNTAQRTAFIGTLGSRRSVQPRMMKRLVETYIVTGEMAVAEKFIKVLESYPRLSAWASSMRPLLNEEVAAATDWVAEKRRLMPVTDNLYDMQNSFPKSVEAIIMDCPENKAALEYLLSFVLMYKDINNFMGYIEPYKGQNLPKLYQEAICVYQATKPDEQILEAYNIDPKIWNRFANYDRNIQMMNAETAYKMYGDTYYYYLQYGATPEPPETNN